MTSMFDYDDSVNMAFDAKIAGKNLVTAKHELLTKTGDFLFMAHSDRELAFRMQMVEEDIERTAHRRLANVSDSKAKLVRAVFDEWSLRHASCQFCKVAKDSYTNDPNSYKGRKDPEWMAKNGPNDYHQHYPSSDKEGGFTCPGCGRLFHTREEATGAYGTCPACDLGNNPRNPNYNRRDEMGHPAPNSEFPFSPSGHNPNQDDKNNFNKKASDDDSKYHWDPSKKTPYPSQVPNKNNPNKTTPWHEKPQQPYPVKNPDYPNKGEGLRKNDTFVTKKQNPEINLSASTSSPSRRTWRIAGGSDNMTGIFVNAGPHSYHLGRLSHTSWTTI
jgi:hypothetical protein